MPALGERMSVSDALKNLLLDIARQQSLDAVMRKVVEGLAGEEHIALARIWLIRPGDICSTCPMAAQCPDQNPLPAPRRQRWSLDQRRRANMGTNRWRIRSISHGGPKSRQGRRDR
ncbi:MAG: hypothetical protein R3E58_12070 [Phycisphaerae bacterium]